MRRSRARDEGFTLIELLVVMIIIGILAAIAIPTFLKQREGGYQATMKSDLRNAATAAESFAVDNGGTYAALDAAALIGQDFRASQHVTLSVHSADAISFCLEATDDRMRGFPSPIYSYSKDDGVPKRGACS